MKNIFQHIMVYLFIMKHKGKYADGSYKPNGLNFYNPLSWIVFSVAIIVVFFYEGIKGVKEEMF